MQSMMNQTSEKMEVPRESTQGMFWQFILRAPKVPDSIYFLLSTTNTNKRRPKVWGHHASSSHHFSSQQTGGQLQENSILALSLPALTSDIAQRKWFLEVGTDVERAQDSESRNLIFNPECAPNQICALDDQASFPGHQSQLWEETP